ncbi:MAG: T9SS type A sorting domain-containing protein [Bacteroidales bacterium]|jgi:hypothetical protein|nr:T9SS type A sorting domain-containing protein [Bacteroidales bacterium]
MTRKNYLKMKVSVSFIIVFTLALCSTMNVFAQFSGGDGSSGNPYRISNSTDLRNLSILMMSNSGLSSYRTAYYIVTNDIDMSDTTWGSWAGSLNSNNYAAAGSTQSSNWIPIGAWTSATATNPNFTTGAYIFKGQFNGQNHTISNLVCKKPTISGTTYNYVGLFGAVGENCVIENVVLDNCEFWGGSGVSAICGCAFGNGGGSVNAVIIRNCKVYYTTIHGASTTGGIIGNNIGASIYSCAVDNTTLTTYTGNNFGGLIGDNRVAPYMIMDSCYVQNSTIETYSGNSFGGLIGYNVAPAAYNNTIKNSFVKNTTFYSATAIYAVGGLFGETSRSIILDCYGNYNTINVKGYAVGGFMGRAASGGYNTIKRCYVTNSKVTSTLYNIGGFAGNFGQTSATTGYNTMDSCWVSYTTVNSTSSGDYCGGMIGRTDYYDTIRYCYSIHNNVISGPINNPTSTGNWYGGMIGWSNYGCVISDCFATYCNIMGGHDLGGLIGDPGDEATSVYERCYTTRCNIYGTAYVAGLFGGGNAAFTVRDCYSSLCFVQGNDFLGGLVGFGGALYIQNSYSTNQIYRTATTLYAGGLCGNSTDAAHITNSYYIDTYQTGTSWTPLAVANRGVAMTSEAMLDPAFITTLNNGRTPGPWYQDTTLYVNGGYPILEISRDRPGVTYQIWNVDDMREFTQMVYDGHDTYGENYALMADIDFANAPAVPGLYDGNYQLRPIGYCENYMSANNKPFCGTFDGNNNRIYNLNIVDPTAFYIGLFGYLGSGAYIRDVALSNCNIQGDSFVGSIVGYAVPQRTPNAPENMNGSGDIFIEKSYSRGYVTGNDLIGGFIGCAEELPINNNATVHITDCYTRCNVEPMESPQRLGSFAGLLSSPTVSITNAYSTGTCPQPYFIGGALYEDAEINNTYALLYGEGATPKTKAEMKTSAFTSLLGASFMDDVVPWARNNGYPILGFEPLSTDLCIIEDEQIITVSTTGDFNSRPTRIIIEDGGSLRNKTANVFNNVTVERNLLNECYVFTSSAFGNITAGNYLGENGSLVYNNVSNHSPVSILQFNYGTNMWSGDPGGYTYLGYNSIMEKGHGYLSYVLDPDYENTPSWLEANQGRIVKLSTNAGNLYGNAEIDLNLYNGGNQQTHESSVNGYWFAMGNPFGGSLWAKPFIHDNGMTFQGDVIYTFDGKNQIWNTLLGTDVNARVRIGEGFFVAGYNNSRGPGIVFLDGHQDKATSKSGDNIEQIKIVAKAHNIERPAYIAISQQADNTFEGKDAYMMFAWNAKVVEPYFIVENHDLVVNAIKDLPYAARMSLNTGQDNTAALTFKDIPADVQVSFIDLDFGTVDTVTEESVINVNVVAGSNSGRFVVLLQRKDNSLNKPVAENDLNLWTYNNRLTVSGNDLQKIEIYNTLGQLVYNQSISGNSYSTLLNLNTGSYIAKATSVSGSKTIKFIINK